MTKVAIAYHIKVPDGTTLQAEGAKRRRIDGKIRSSVDLLNLPSRDDNQYQGLSAPDLNFNDGKPSIGTYTIQCSNTILHAKVTMMQI